MRFATIYKQTRAIDTVPLLLCVQNLEKTFKICFAILNLLEEEIVILLFWDLRDLCCFVIWLFKYSKLFEEYYFGYRDNKGNQEVLPKL